MRAALAPAALVLLALAPGCQRLDPAAYRAAARRISFRLVSLTPRLDLAFPLERSALTLEAVLELENPTELPLDLRGAQAQVWLDQTEARRVAALAFPQGVHLPARGKAQIRTALRLTHGDLREAWVPLRRVLLEHEAATWRMEGSARIELMGLPLDLPFTVRKDQGRPR